MPEAPLIIRGGQAVLPLEVETGERHAISIGYKFLHISNGFRTDVNPGIDNNVVYLGFSILR